MSLIKLVKAGFFFWKAIVHISAIAFNSILYVFFIKKYIISPTINQQQSWNKLADSQLKLATKLLSLKESYYLKKEDIDLLLQTNLNPNLMLQCLAFIVQTKHQIYQLPSNGIKPSANFPEWGIENYALIRELDQKINRKPNQKIINLIETKKSDLHLISESLKDSDTPHKKIIFELTKCDLIITDQIPAELTSFDFLELMFQHLNPNGLLLFTSELIAPFNTEKEQKKNLILHHLHSILPLLWTEDILQTINNINGNDLLLYNQLRFNIYASLILIEDNAILEVELLLKNLFQYCQTFLQDRLFPPALSLFRTAVAKLATLIETLEHHPISKTSVTNLIMLAESLGFKLIKNERLYPTHGEGLTGGGKYLFVLEKI